MVYKRACLRFPNCRKFLFHKIVIYCLIFVVTAYISKAFGTQIGSYLYGNSNQVNGQLAEAVGHNNSAIGSRTLVAGSNNVARFEASSSIGSKNYAGWIRGNNIHQMDKFSASSNIDDYFNITAADLDKLIALDSRSGMLALGVTNVALGDKSIAIGNHNISGSLYSLALGKSNLAIGLSSQTVGVWNTVRGSYSNAFGFKNYINIGSEFSSALGAYNQVNGSFSIAIGHQNIVDVNNTIAIGNRINSNGQANSIILGNNSIGVSAVDFPHDVQVEFGDSNNLLVINKDWSGVASTFNGVFSIGSLDKERQIKFVAPGAISANSTDAINGSQLYSTIRAIGKASSNFSMIFKGDNPSESIERRIGETLTFNGGAIDLLSENNIGIKVENSQLNIKLAKQINDITNITTESGTVLNNGGLVVYSGPSVTTNGINANNKAVSNVLTNEMSQNGDAANVGYVKKTVENLKLAGYRFRDDYKIEKTFEIGSTLEIGGDNNINTRLTESGIKISLNPRLSNVESIAILNGPTFNDKGVIFDQKHMFTRDQIRLGDVTINSNGNIIGVADPTNDTDAANKRYVDKQLKSLGNTPFTLGTNAGKLSKKLGETMFIKGADSNNDKSLFDMGNNIMTWIDGEGDIRIGIKKDVTLSSVTSKNENGKSSVLKPDALVFNGVGGIEGADGQITLEVTSSGLADVRNKKSARLKLNNTEVATMNDGLKFGANSGDEVSNLLNSKVLVSGNKNNTDWSKFDEGSNIMTNIEQSSDGQTNIIIALKRDLELDSATFGHGPNIVEGTNTQKGGKDGYIKVVNKVGKTAIVIDGGSTSNDVGPSITVSDTKSVGGGDFYII